MRLLWHRLTESPATRLNRIRQLGLVRFCFTYAVVFPLCHLLTASFRAVFTGNLVAAESLPRALAGWSVAGGSVAVVVWLAVILSQRRQTEKIDSRAA